MPLYACNKLKSPVRGEISVRFSIPKARSPVRGAMVANYTPNGALRREVTVYYYHIAPLTGLFNPTFI
jgi:hypothetical protein